MSSIRRQSIISSFVIYIGFALGALNTYLFTKEGLFNEEQYGLTTIFVSMAVTIQAFACLAMPTYVFKFHPYYEHHLSKEKNDMPAIALLTGVAGFLLVLLAGWIFQGFMAKKYVENSPDFVKYYFWVFPMGFGLTMFSILESWGWSLHKPVLTSFLKEVVWRLLVTVLIALFVLGAITDFGVFIKLYGLTYLVIALVLFGYFYFTGQLSLTLQISKVTRRYFSKIISLCIFVYSGTIIQTTATVFDTMLIASVLTDGLTKTGIFTFAQFLTSIIQVPQRAIIASSVGHLAKAWREKNLQKIQKIYQRSSINLLIFALCILSLISLNFNDAIITFGLKGTFLQGFYVFVFLGLAKVVEVGCGLSTHVITTSTHWRFEVTSGIILLVCMLPLSYILVKKYDIVGPAIANLISYSIFNAVRILFLWKKFRLQPFTKNSLHALLLSVVCFGVCYYLFKHMAGFGALIIRSVVFLSLFGGATLFFKLSPDIQPVWESLLKRLHLKK